MAIAKEKGWLNSIRLGQVPVPWATGTIAPHSLSYIIQGIQLNL